MIRGINHFGRTVLFSSTVITFQINVCVEKQEVSDDGPRVSGHTAIIHDGDGFVLYFGPTLATPIGAVALESGFPFDCINEANLSLDMRGETRLRDSSSFTVIRFFVPTPTLFWSFAFAALAPFGFGLPRTCLHDGLDAEALRQEAAAKHAQIRDTLGMMDSEMIEHPPTEDRSKSGCLDGKA